MPLLLQKLFCGTEQEILIR